MIKHTLCVPFDRIDSWEVFKMAALIEGILLLIFMSLFLAYEGYICLL